MKQIPHCLDLALSTKLRRLGNTGQEEAAVVSATYGTANSPDDTVSLVLATDKGALQCVSETMSTFAPPTSFVVASGRLLVVCFATSVSSRSLTFRQAMLAAAICEFAGAVAVGARVTSTIKNGIIDLDEFNGDAAVLLLGFTCVIIGSCTWLTIATRNAMPVSTTHTVVGAIIGVGIALHGHGGSVKWGWNGVSQIFASWGIAPAVAGCLAAITFLITKYLVLRSSSPVKMGLIASPVYFFIVAGVLTTSIIVKGSPSLNLDELPPNVTAGAVVGTAAVVSILSLIFWLPWVYCQVVRGDYTIRWYHFFMGPLLWSRQAPEDAVTADSAVPDYYAGHREDDHVPASINNADDVEASNRRQQTEHDEDRESSKDGNDEKLAMDKDRPVTDEPTVEKSKLQMLEAKLSQSDSTTGPDGRPLPPKYRTFDGSWIEPWNLYTVLRYNALPWAWYTVSAGCARHPQVANEWIGQGGPHACTASFAHGANDVSNAVGPLSVVYSVWSTQLFPSSTEPTPIWILVFGGAAIVIGLGTYGWKLMSVLGNRLTLHSPSRGFSMEFGASITVVLASYLGLPVSTTQSITGATIAVSLCDGGRATNWKGVLWIFFSWVLTLPIAGLISGLTFAIVLNAPRWSV
ncbi:hypothetical protein L7F22_022370 [Adiantum nelumboides]|nr:hypothetical protein [Adiantum nelumboides]